jgi:hypothetical protein
MTAVSYKTADARLHRYLFAAGVLTSLLSNLCTADDSFCGALPAAGFDQPPNVPRTGRYINSVYGYSVNIPASFSGYSASTGPQRGFGIVLSWKPRAFLRIDAAYDAFFDITAQGVHRSDLIAMRQHATVVDDRAATFTLAHKEGNRYLTRVRCGDDPELFVHDTVIVMVNREIYRLALQTVPERYDADSAVLNAMLRSWGWEPIRPMNPTAGSSSGEAPLP